MAENGSKWLQVALSVVYLALKSLQGTWLFVAQGGLKWLKMASSGRVYDCKKEELSHQFYDAVS